MHLGFEMEIRLDAKEEEREKGLDQKTARYKTAILTYEM
jgi:hypothetical protein